MIDASSFFYQEDINIPHHIIELIDSILNGLSDTQQKTTERSQHEKETSMSNMQNPT